jgi:HAD superfamily hydrolase (TIGR01509 family)
MIKVITFDLDGVYFTPQSFKDFKSKLPKKIIDEEQINWVLYKSPEMMNFKSGKISEDEYWEYVRKALLVDIEKSEIYKLLRDCYQINQKVRNYVNEIKTRGFKTAICSNNFITRIRELNIKFNFLQDFDIKIFSYEVGITKPNIGIFQELVRQSQVKPQEIAYSDDDETKLSGAKELGIQSFVYEDFDQFKTEIEDLISKKSPI